MRAQTFSTGASMTLEMVTVAIEAASFRIVVIWTGYANGLKRLIKESWRLIAEYENRALPGHGGEERP
jgi:hypothetical protein